MPSSTFSSSGPPSLRLLAVMILLLSVALLATQTVVRMVGGVRPEKIWVSGDARQMLDQLDEVAVRMKGRRNVIVFGSSRTGRGFDRRVYEAEIQQRCGVEIQAWRFGFGFIGISPTTQALMAHHILSALRAADVKWDLALVEFTPFQATARISTGEYGAGQDEWMVHLSSLQHLASGWSQDLHRTLRLLTYALIYEGSNPHRLTRWAAERIDPPRRKLANSEVRALFRQLRQTDPRWAPVGLWRADLRGASWFMSTAALSPEGRATLKAVRSALADERAGFIDKDRRWRIDCCDAEALQLDPSQLAAFRRLLATFEAMSNRTMVFMPPENRERLPVSDAGDRRVQRFMASLPHPVVDMALDARFSDRDFFDTTHLDEFGAAKFSRTLAKQTAAALCPTR